MVVTWLIYCKLTGLAWKKTTNSHALLGSGRRWKTGLKLYINRYTLFTLYFSSVCLSIGEGRKKSMLGIPASSDYTLGGNDVDMTGIVGNFRTPSGSSEACLLKKLPNGKLGKKRPLVMPPPYGRGHKAILRSVRRPSVCLSLCPVFWFCPVRQMATCARRRFTRILSRGGQHGRLYPLPNAISGGISFRRAIPILLYANTQWCYWFTDVPSHRLHYNKAIRELEYLAVYGRASMAAFRQLSTHIGLLAAMCERRD